ncbi:MAG: hypothetical protein PVF04_03640 [Anaerolineae bacterium]|jgi:hypothetical protein
MNKGRRILIAVVILIVIGGGVLGLEALRRRRRTEANLEPGSIPIYVDGQLEAAFTPDDLERLEQVSFQDAEEGKRQEGWMLRDVLLLHLSEESLTPTTRIVVISSSRDKAAELTWAEVDDTENMVMFDLSGRGTLKLVSKLERLDVRDEWVQDVEEIEIESP